MLEQWIPLAKLEEVPVGTVKKFKIDFRSGWLVRTNKGCKAYVDFCTHAGGSLVHRGEEFRCVRHGATFAVDTGVPKSGPACDGAPLLPVEVRVDCDTIYFKRVLSDD